MKCPRYDMAKAKMNVERGSPEKALSLHEKDSPIKDPLPSKHPAEKVSIVLFPQNDTPETTQDKENQTAKSHESNFDEVLEDSGYSSLYSSHIDEGDDHSQGKPLKIPLHPPSSTVTPKQSPKCEESVASAHPVSLRAVSTPVDHCFRKPLLYSLSSTPSEQYTNSNLPIIKFQQAVCQELTKSYTKNKRYDWTVVSKVAKDHLLHQVIGRHMGLDFVDVFSSLLSKNMRSILADILALLGDMDLISCKQVSKTWRKIIHEDNAARKRCRQAEQILKESQSSVKVNKSDLTRDMGVSRMVLSCMQKVASPHPSSASSSSSLIVHRRNTATQKNSQSNMTCSRFNEYVQVASTLKQCESLRSCKNCGSPATHSPEAHRATCMRPSCLFDFCTICLEAFHGSNPCRTARCRSRLPNSGKAQSLLPGSAQSKRNIRRL